MSNSIKVIGGNPLIGTITPVANKNAILPALVASLLTSETVTYTNVPQSTDVKILLELLRNIGATVDDKDYNNLKITTKKIKTHTLDRVLAEKLRSSVFFAGPLLARVGKVEIPTPGGCVLGVRSMSSHLDSFKKAGIKVVLKKDAILLLAPKNPKKKINIWQVEASVTASENLLMYLAGTEQTAVITDCASEPHTKNLIQMLNDMGAKITGGGSNVVTITGYKNLKGVTFIPYPEHIDISSLIIASAVTKGNIEIVGGNIPEIMDGMIDWYKKFGVSIKKVGKNLIINQKRSLKLADIYTNFPLAAPDLPKFVPRTWPGYPIDALPPLVTLATKTKGRILIQNWMYENGLDFVNILTKMGANIFTIDPQKIIVTGPTQYKGGEVFAPGIIQATMAIFLAALSDKATTIIHGADALKRRYPNFVADYKKLGANIEEVSA